MSGNNRTRKLYMDGAATMPTDPEVIESMFHSHRETFTSYLMRKRNLISQKRKRKKKFPMKVLVTQVITSHEASAKKLLLNVKLRSYGALSLI